MRSSQLTLVVTMSLLALPTPLTVIDGNMFVNGGDDEDVGGAGDEDPLAFLA